MTLKLWRETSTARIGVNVTPRGAEWAPRGVGGYPPIRVPGKIGRFRMRVPVSLA
jgi:hypothetical protein